MKFNIILVGLEKYGKGYGIKYITSKEARRKSEGNARIAY